MTIRKALLGLAALAGVTLASGAASAMPNGLPRAGAMTTPDVSQVRYVCDAWGRCHWRPNAYSSYGYYGPRHHGWHRPHHSHGPRHHGRHGHHHGGHRR